MFNIQYLKAEPTTYLMQYKKGRLKRQGAGLAFWYYAPTTSLVAIPLGSTDLPFMFKETTSDYQEVTLQGQLVYRVTAPERLSALMNFTLDRSGRRYRSEDPDKLKNRILNLVQVQMRTAVEALPLRKALTASQMLVNKVQQGLRDSEVIASLGIEIMDLSILAIKPVPETARALEASVREQLLEEADEAIYRRRNASIEQERAVKENELQTEMAVETKQQQIRENKLKAQRQFQQQERDMAREALAGEIEQEEQRRALVAEAADNRRTEADVKAYELAGQMDALSRVDARVLEALTMANLDPQQVLAQGFRELANSSNKIGQLTITPDLFESLVQRRA